MKRLSMILSDWWKDSRRGYGMELLDLYREQSRFDEAESMISVTDLEKDDVTGQLIAKLIKERQPAPMRYRM
jgi:hypothetical protein